MEPKSMEVQQSELPLELEKKILAIFREFFDRSERKRRWKIADDIPWDQCNRNLNPVIADVVETFTAIELYLPDTIRRSSPRSGTAKVGRGSMRIGVTKNRSTHSHSAIGS
jgi:hypothetical protein